MGVQPRGTTDDPGIAVTARPVVPHDVLVVIPSISASQVRSSLPWIRELEDLGLRVRVVANSRSLATSDVDVHLVDTGENPGFSASILRAVRDESDWSWLVIANDDLQVGAADIDALWDTLSGHAPVDGPSVVLFDPEPPRRIPDVRAVLGMLSLVSNVGETLARQMPGRLLGRRDRSRGTGDTPARGASPFYKAFNLVAISREAWELVGGLDPRLVFCYEDADFVRRYTAASGLLPRVRALDVRGERSASTRRHIESVLPVIVHSAREYLLLLGIPRRRADRLIGAALCLRIGLAPFSHAPLRAHLRGIRRSRHLLRTGTVPRLPDYDSL